jgi:DNA-binding CsgD family transcriptional regulator
VKTHRRNIYRKLGVSTREEMAERAAEVGVREPPDH